MLIPIAIEVHLNHFPGDIFVCMFTRVAGMPSYSLSLKPEDVLACGPHKLKFGCDRQLEIYTSKVMQEHLRNTLAIFQHHVPVRQG